MGKIIILGECMVEFAPLANGDFKLGFAGDTFNVAWYLRQLLPYDWNVQYFTNIGDDMLSEQMLRFMEDSGIDTSHVQKVEGQNIGLYVISLNKGERSFNYWRSAAAARSLADDPVRLAEATQGADCVIFSGITLGILSDTARTNLLSQMELLKNTGVQVVFDPNIRFRLWADAGEIRHWITKAYKVCTMAFPSFSDEAEVFGDVDVHATAKRILKLGAKEVVVKHGGSACLLSTAEAVFSVAPEHSIEPIDTTGAGDSFNAAYLAARLQLSTAESSAHKAHYVAGQVINAHGALVTISVSVKHARQL